MLLLNLKYGEYLTIGEDTYIQFFKHSGASFRAAIHAPRDVTILRGAVHERTGDRPEGLQDKVSAAKSPSESRYNAKHYEEWRARAKARESERRNQAAQKAAVLQNLTDCVSRLDGEEKETLLALCRQLASLEAGQDSHTA